MQKNIETILSYVESVLIVRMPVFEAAESAIESARNLPEFDDNDQAIAIGSQIAEFAKSVPVRLRPQISNSLLLAQLAANKAIEKDGTTKEWYATYINVLSNIGWKVEGDIDAVHNISGTGAQVHKEIIPVLTLALGGAGAAAATLVVPLLEGLENMSKNSPWITLFDRESKRAKANQFQICYVSSSNGNAPKLVLVCFGLDASNSVTQVLFFRFSSASATFTHFQSELSVEPNLLDGIADKIESRVKEHVSSFVTNIEI